MCMCTRSMYIHYYGMMNKCCAVLAQPPPLLLLRPQSLPPPPQPPNKHFGALGLRDGGRKKRRRGGRSKRALSSHEQATFVNNLQLATKTCNGDASLTERPTSLCGNSERFALVQCFSRQLAPSVACLSFSPRTVLCSTSFVYNLISSGATASASASRGKHAKESSEKTFLSLFRPRSISRRHHQSVSWGTSKGTYVVEEVEMEWWARIRDKRNSRNSSGKTFHIRANSPNHVTSRGHAELLLSTHIISHVPISCSASFLFPTMSAARPLHRFSLPLLLLLE